MQDSKTSKKDINFDDLVFVRLIDPIHIPRYLLDQIREKSWQTDKFYDFMKVLCLIQGRHGPELNPSNFLYAVVNDKLKQVKGFLWASLDLLTNCLIINNFSMDREYWNKGQAIGLLEKKAKTIKKDLGLDKIIWITSHPKLCEKLGFKKTKEAVMIYQGE